MLRIIAIFCLVLGAGLLRAQTTEPLIYTVGKVFKATGHHYAYILWQPGEPASTFGKEFAVYRKDGDSNSINPYALLGRTKLQSGPGAMQALLKLGGKFDANASTVADRINTLYAESISEPGTQPDPAPTEPGMDEAKKLSHLLNIAKNDSKVLERLFFLGRAHPGIYLTLGHGFTAKTTANSIETYEVREINTVGTDLRVIGRVTLDAANPTQLTRTSRPFQIYYPAKAEHQEAASPKDHLMTRLRWGTPPSLRRLIPHSFGYNLYRVKEATAVSMGWDNPAVFPDTTVLKQMVQAATEDADPIAKRVNTLPLMPNSLMSAGQAADIITDSTTFFTHDDNEAPQNRFNDGDTFYYFIAARDIAGHPGPISAGTRVIICDRLPPTAPAIESIRNIFETATVANLYDLKGNQHFRIRIRQSSMQPIKNAATKYHIYRWGDHTEHIREGGNPVTNLVGTVMHMVGEKYVDWDDNGAGAPLVNPADTTLQGKTWWYTVRAEDNTSCSPKNLSPHSPPIFGVLRDRVGPGLATGHVTQCRYFPAAVCSSTFLTTPAAIGLRASTSQHIISCHRLNKLIHSVEIEFYNTTTNPYTVLFRTHRFFTVPHTKYIPVPENLITNVFRVRCHTKTGRSSDWTVCEYNRASPDKGQVSVTPVDLRTDKRCDNVGAPSGKTPEIHEIDGPNGIIVGPGITVTIPTGAAEYRIYRRVGHHGSFQMIARGAGSTLPEPLPADIDIIDPAPPTENGIEVCYFAQIFDENGNSGPRTKLGCVTIQSGNLATPMLSEVTYLAETSGQAQVKLNWFCAPVGVERFEIWAAADAAADPQITSPLLSPKLEVTTAPIINDDVAGLAFCGYQTKTLASGQIGEGAEFSVTVAVPSSQSLTFAVRAVGQGPNQSSSGSDARSQGPFSNTILATWQPPSVLDQGVIPWPALAVPSVGDISLDVLNYQKGEGPFFAAPLPAGDTHSATILMGVFAAEERDGDKDYQPIIPIGKDPLELFFSYRKQNIHPIPAEQIESITPFVIYRHQLPSSAYPNAVPNLVQVSPLIDRIAYQDILPDRKIRDPFFRFINVSSTLPQYQIPVMGGFSRDPAKSLLVTGSAGAYATLPYLKDCNSLLYWVDPMPVAHEAKYQYLIVHFDPRGEIDRVIPTNFVTQP
tara:strand:- start:25332 stop:28787 length:3456 start_codon:yes stop_codon:yes gene_type:complete